MEPGARFCPNHPDLRFPPFAQECSVCNHPIETYPTIPGILPPAPFEVEKGVVLSRLAELDVVDDGPLTAEEIEPIVEAAVDLKLDRLLVSRQKKAPARSHHKAKH